MATTVATTVTAAIAESAARPLRWCRACHRATTTSAPTAAATTRR